MHQQRLFLQFFPDLFGWDLFGSFFVFWNNFLIVERNFLWIIYDRNRKRILVFFFLVLDPKMSHQAELPYVFLLYMIHKFVPFSWKLDNYRQKQIKFSEALAIAVKKQENTLTSSTDWMPYSRFFEVSLGGSFWTQWCKRRTWSSYSTSCFLGVLLNPAHIELSLDFRFKIMPFNLTDSVFNSSLFFILTQIGVLFLIVLSLNSYASWYSFQNFTHRLYPAPFPDSIIFLSKQTASKNVDDLHVMETCYSYEDNQKQNQLHCTAMFC